MQELWNQMPLAPLGPGEPVREVKAKLQSCASSWPAGIEPNQVAACQAGLWLGFNFLDESHAISQELNTIEGSYWHAILHRREPDPSNAAYWFRRVGNHPIFPMLAAAAANLGLRFPSERWDPFAFVNLCEKHRDSGTDQEEVLRRVQYKEVELLLEWCVGNRTLATTDH
jgi:hypothetical protein